MKFKSSLLATGLLLSLSSLPTQASLTSYSVNGEYVVYDDSANVTWLADANLLDTLFNNLGQSNVIQAIQAATLSITDSTGRAHWITDNDFNSNQSGATSWYGAKAFISYLNSINYAGSNLWTLPTTGSIPQFDLSQTDSHLVNSEESSYGYDSDEHDSDSSEDTQPIIYWQDTEFANNLKKAWQVDITNGDQKSVKKSKDDGYVWAVTPGKLAAVPLPGTAWLLLTGMIGVLGMKRFSKKSAYSEASDA